MENSNLYSIKYVVGNDFVFENKVEVEVFFIYNLINIVKTIDVKKKKGATDTYYAKEAEKIINKQIKNGKLENFAKKYISKKLAKKRIIALVSAVCLSATIGTVSYKTWEHFEIIHQNEIIVHRIVDIINALNENSTEEEVNAAVKEFEDLPKHLQNMISEETKAFLEQQVALLEMDKASAKEIDNITINFTIDGTTETEIETVEEKINTLTHRAHTMLREGTDRLIQDIKNAIEVDKAKAKAINDAVEALDVDYATADEVLEIVMDTIMLSDRGYSYVKEESIQKIAYLIEYWEFADEILEEIAPIAREYATDGTLCTIDDIKALENVYNDYFTTSVKQFADEAPYYFSTNIATAKTLWNRDYNIGMTLADLASKLNPETCLDEDIKIVTDKYEELQPNARAKGIADANGYTTNLEAAKNALNEDKEKTIIAYNEMVAPILDENCSQGAIDGVQEALNEYLEKVTPRLQTLITTGEEYNLQKKINEAQDSYNEDFDYAVNFYNGQLEHLTPNSTLDEINAVQTDFNNFKSEQKPRRVQFLASGGSYDLQAKIDEAINLYHVDESLASQFNNALNSLPSSYSQTSLEQKMVMASAYKYYNDKADEKHIFLTNRAKTLVDSNCKIKLDSLMSEAEGKFKLTMNPVFNATEGAEDCFSSDNIVRFSSAVGLYIEATLTRVSPEGSKIFNPNPIITKVMGSSYESDYAKVFDYNTYNHVSCRIFVPPTASNDLKIEGVRYGSNIAYNPEHFVTITPTKASFNTIDFAIDSTYDFGYGKYNGYSSGIKDAKNSDIGTIFKITAHYSEKR